MNFDSIPEAFQTKLRVALMAALYNGPKDFKTLKLLTSSTDGNLSIQLTKLEEQGYLISRKSFVNKKSHTDYEATQIGKDKFEEYVDFLATIISTK
ncbi:MAG TPA: MarR family transcriptional regulator [Lachnospiraceae bacterium]|jgi:DNA-binding HxlR family transcriptional regulator|nr:MarR family transcriptional regulator [Lachnospiraceae bacterium]HCM12015.1 MarR family transcriptional regulator [Lachnospiraceae bacterium]